MVIGVTCHIMAASINVVSVVYQHQIWQVGYYMLIWFDDSYSTCSYVNILVYG